MCQEFESYPPSCLASPPSQDKHAKQFLSADSIPTSWPSFFSQVAKDLPCQVHLLIGALRSLGHSEKSVVVFGAHTGGTSVHSIRHPDLQDFQ